MLSVTISNVVQQLPQVLSAVLHHISNLHDQPSTNLTIHGAAHDQRLTEPSVTGSIVLQQLQQVLRDVVHDTITPDDQFPTSFMVDGVAHVHGLTVPSLTVAKANQQLQQVFRAVLFQQTSNRGHRSLVRNGQERSTPSGVTVRSLRTEIAVSESFHALHSIMHSMSATFSAAAADVESCSASGNQFAASVC